MSTTAVAGGRPQALVQVADFWPSGGRSLSRKPGRDPALLVLPTSRSPRLLVPTGLPGAAVMLTRMSRSKRQRFAQEALAVAVRRGWLSWLPVARLSASKGPGLEDFVREHVPGTHAVGVILGPPRANGKPVLQIFAADGQTLAFGKVGHDGRAAALVRGENAVLMDPALASLRSIDVPAVIYSGQWNGLEILLLSAMSAAQSRASSWTVPLSEMVEVAESAAVTSSPVTCSTYWEGLRDRVTALPPSATAPAPDALTRIGEQLIDLRLGFGRWHGDWAPWNMGWQRNRLQLWDWEQSTTGVPLGFDLVHFLMQRELEGTAEPQAALQAVQEGMALAPRDWWSSSEQLDATIVLYLIEILHRYAFLGGDQLPPNLTLRVARLQAMASLLGLGAARV